MSHRALNEQQTGHLTGPTEEELLADMMSMQDPPPRRREPTQAERGYRTRPVDEDLLSTAGSPEEHQDLEDWIGISHEPTTNGVPPGYRFGRSR